MLNAAARAHRYQRLHVLGAESQAPGDHRGKAGADLDCRPLAAQRDPAGQRGGAEEELGEDGAERDVSVPEEQGRLGLGDAAAAGVGKPAVEQEAGDEGAEHRHQGSAHAGAAGGIEPGREPAGEEDERHDDQADQRADHQAEHQGELALFAPELVEPAQHSLHQRQPGGSWSGGSGGSGPASHRRLSARK